MAIDPHYIPAFSIDEGPMIDKDTGELLAGGIVHFERDSQRGMLKPIYQITGTEPNYSYIQLDNPLTLSSIGTFVDSLGNPVVPYFRPYVGDTDEVDLYYVWVESSGLVKQFDRQAVPYLPGSAAGMVANSFTNELSNPQFAQVLFDTSTPNYVYTFVNQTLKETQIAPSWDLIITCAGTATVTVNQLRPLGTLNDITNPGTVLNIKSSGSISLLQLRQRLYGSPNLWGKGWLSASFVAITHSDTEVKLPLKYSQSNGSVNGVTVVDATLTADGVYRAYPGSFNIPQSDSTANFPNAYVDIYFDLPISIELDITSVMVSSTGVSMANIIYEQTTLDRQIDQLYHYAYPIVPIGAIIDFFGFATPLHYLPCDYAAYNRINYFQLFKTITTVETVALTSGMATFTVVSAANYRIGMGLEGVGIPAFTTIIGISGSGPFTITMSINATGTASVPVTFFAAGNIFQETVSLTSTVNTFTVASAANYGVNMAISGTGIVPGSIITAISGSGPFTITMSNPASSTVSSLVSFYSPANGDGSTTFNVPDARRRNTIGSGGTVLSLPNSSASPTTFGIGNKLGDVGGQELHLQLGTEVGQHTHPAASGSFRVTTGSGDSYGAGLGSASGFQDNTGLNTAPTPFNIIQPGLVTNKCIRYQ